MDGGAEEKRPMYFNFDCGEAEFGGEKAVVKGSLLFDFVHKFRSPNFPAVQEIRVQLKKWLEDHLRGTPEVLVDCCSLLKLSAHTLAYIQPAAYIRNIEDEISMRKGFWMSVIALNAWYIDNLDDEEKYRQDPDFKTMSKFFSSTMYKIYSFQFSNKEELKLYMEEFGVFKNYPKFYDALFLWFYFAQDFYKDPIMQKCGITKENMVLYGEASEQEYMANSWMDGVGLEKVDSFSLYASRRMHNSGGFVQITLAAIMDGFHKPELSYIFRDQHVVHFRFLCVATVAFVHDLLSLKKDLKTGGDTNNVIRMWLKKGKSLQESVDKAITKHNQLLRKVQELYNFLQVEHQNDPKLLGYLDSVLGNFSGICQFQASFCERYGDVKWSIDQEPNA